LNTCNDELETLKPSMEADKSPKLIGDDFIDEIMALVKECSLSYMDAVIHWCECNGMDVDVGAELVNKSDHLKSKIEEEAESLNFIRRTNRLF
jgi:hypothetical protein